jgi:hypothetical protein
MITCFAAPAVAGKRWLDLNPEEAAAACGKSDAASNPKIKLRHQKECRLGAIFIAPIPLSLPDLVISRIEDGHRATIQIDWLWDGGIVAGITNGVNSRIRSV